MRKNWKMRISADRRGKITTGKKTQSKSGKEIPTSLEYFNIEKFPELVAAYGDKPEKLFIAFPSNDIDQFFQTEYVVWAQSKSGGAWKKRSCDGEECTHHVPEVLNVDGKQVKYNAGEVHECFCCGTDDSKVDSDDQCKCYTGFSAYVLHPDTGQMVLPRAYRFQTNSVNSGDNLLTELFKLFENFGGVYNIPFILSVKIHEKQTDKGKKSKFPIWDLQAYGTVQMLNSFTKREQLPTNDQNAYMLIPESKLLQLPASAEESNETQQPKNIPEQDVSPDVESSPISETPDSETVRDSRTENASEQVEDEDPTLDILERVGILSEIDLNMTDPHQVVGQVVKMLMEISDNKKATAKSKLKACVKEQHKADGTVKHSYESTKDLIDNEDIKFIVAVFERVKKMYRNHLLKIEKAETQGSLV